MADRIIELKWKCNKCGEWILGRYKRCPNDGDPRENGEMQGMDGLGADDYDSSGYNKAATVTDAALLDLFTDGPDWFCEYCSAGNRNSSTRCDGIAGEAGCGAPRDDTAGEREARDTPPDYACEIDLAMASFSQPSIHTRNDRSSRYDDDIPVDRNWRRAGLAAGGLSTFLVVAAGAMLLFFTVGAIWWAFTTHESQGTVAGMTWKQSTHLQSWQNVQTRKWKHRTSQRQETRPRNGQGERAGMALVGGCRSEHYDDERYACGTDRVCRATTERYACGETCRPNGNGSATCSTKYCTRPGPDKCSNETKYCNRPIYKDKCNYQTQEWKTVKTETASGREEDTRWPKLDPGPLQRVQHSSDYTVSVMYQDRGKPYTYDHKPPGEDKYKSWDMGETVTLKVNNLGGVRSIVHGGIEIGIEEAEEE